MGWSGIWLVRRRPGETDEAAIDRTTDASIELRDGEPWIVPNDKAEEVAADDDFIVAAAALAQSINPQLAVTEEHREDGHLQRMTLDDGAGPVIINLFRGEIQLKPPRGWSDLPDADGTGFHAMWSQAKAIAERLDCVAHDPDFGDVADLSLEEDEAREAYGWL